MDFRNLTCIALCYSAATAFAGIRTKLPCTQPAILKISKTGNDLYYQMNNARPHKLMKLGEVSEAVRDCSPERMLFVVATPEVPVGALRVPGKEQITRVRYFVQFPNGTVEELGPSLYYSKLPTTPDILPEPAYEDTPPSAITNTKGKQ